MKVIKNKGHKNTFIMFGKLFGGLFGKKEEPEATMGDIPAAGSSMDVNSESGMPQDGMEGGEDTQNTV